MPFLPKTELSSFRLFLQNGIKNINEPSKGVRANLSYATLGAHISSTYFF
jgi:hypothetical protein